MSLSDSNIKDIQYKLTDIKKELQSFSDNFWKSINHNNTKEVEKGCQFQTEFNQLFKSFNKDATAISDLINNYFPSSKDSTVQAENVSEVNHKIIKELDKQTPHYIGEDFTNTKPYAFVFKDYVKIDLLNWTDLYIAFTKVLVELDFKKLQTIADNPKYYSSQNNKYYSKTPSTIFKSEKIRDDFFVEINFSASNFIKRITEMLNLLNIPLNNVTFYLREERL